MASYYYYCIIIIIVITIIVIIITSPTTPLASGQRTPTFPGRRCPRAGLEGAEGLQVEGTAWAEAEWESSPGSRGLERWARGRGDFQGQRLGGVR